MANNVLTMHFEYQIFIKKNIYTEIQSDNSILFLKSVYYDTKFTVLFVSLILPTAVALYHSECVRVCARMQLSPMHITKVLHECMEISAFCIRSKRNVDFIQMLNKIIIF